MEGISIYTCSKCGDEVTVEDPESGVVPGAIACQKERCGGMSVARFARPDETPTPTHEWAKTKPADKLGEVDTLTLARTGRILRPVD